MTRSTQLVLRTVLESQGAFYGFELMRTTGLRTNTIYTILRRLEAAGWITSAWEQVDARGAGRPARRYFNWTATGRDQAAAALDRIEGSR